MGPGQNLPPGISGTWMMTNYRRCWRLSSLRQLGGRGHTPHSSIQGSLWVPGGGRETAMDEREVAFSGEGWGHSKTVQWHTSPPQADTDVSHLHSMLAAGLRMGTPRINTFSRDATPGKTKVSFNCGTTRSSASRTTTQRQWSRRVSSDH